MGIYLCPLKVTSKAKVKTTFFLILIVALMTADAAPQFFGQFPGAVTTKPFVKQHGHNKFVVGAANQGISSLGTNLAAHQIGWAPSLPLPDRHLFPYPTGGK